MKSKEMFEELGWKHNNYEDDTIYYLKWSNDNCFPAKYEIGFDKKDKEVCIFGVITLKELQAINKQVEELGWK